MSAATVNMAFGRYLRFMDNQGEVQNASCESVVDGRRQEHRRRVGTVEVFRDERIDSVGVDRVGQIGRVDQHGEIGATRLCVEDVDR